MKQKGKTGRKLLSRLLTLAMVVGMVPGMRLTAHAADGDTTYTITIPSTLTVENSGWNDAGGISATGTLASGKKLTVTASSDGEFALVNQSDNTKKVGYKLAAASTDTEATTSWSFDSLSSTATTKPMGIIVEDYSSKPAGTYQDTVTFTASVENSSVPVTSITLNKFGTEIDVGQTETISVTAVTPNDATNKTVTWSSDNTAVATVNETTGEVTAVAKGTANIIATANDGSGVTATCAVTVKQLYSFTLTGPYTGETLVVEFYEGQTWNDMVAKYPNTLKVYSGYVVFGGDGFIYPKNGGFIPPTAKIDPNETYEVQ